MGRVYDCIIVYEYIRDRGFFVLMACAVCCKRIAAREARRRLDHPSSIHVKSTLMEIANRLHAAAAQMLFGASTVVCRVCFRSAEKLAKLKEEVAVKEDELQGWMKIPIEASIASLSPEPRGSSPQETPTHIEIPRPYSI